MMDEHEQHVHDLVGAYVLGAVTPEESTLVEQHLATCAACRHLESELREVESLLPSLAGEMAPPPDLKSRLMAMVTAEAATASGAETPLTELPAAPHQAPPGALNGRQPARTPQPAPLPLPDRRSRRSARFSPLLAIAAALLLVIVGAGVWRAISGTPPQPTRVYAMGGQTIPTISGKLAYYKDGHKLVLNLTGLRGIPSGRVYELWLVHTEGSAIVKALGMGEFRPAAHGQGQLTLTGSVVPANMSYYNVAALTVERAPRSLTPTLPIVASGQATPA